MVSWCKNRYSIMIDNSVFIRLVLIRLFNDEVIEFVILFIINKFMLLKVGLFLVFLMICII